MTTNERLKHLQRKWKKLGIARHFPAVHHFSSGKFATESSNLTIFVNYCADKQSRGENTQTLDRALAAAYLHEGGMPVEKAIGRAWSDFGLLTR